MNGPIRETEKEEKVYVREKNRRKDKERGREVERENLKEDNKSQSKVDEGNDVSFHVIWLTN